MFSKPCDTTLIRLRHTAHTPMHRSSPVGRKVQIRSDVLALGHLCATSGVSSSSSTSTRSDIDMHGTTENTRDADDRKPSAYILKPSAFPSVGVRCGGPHKTASGRFVSPHTSTASASYAGQISRSVTHSQIAPT